MEKIRFVEHIKNQIDQGVVDWAYDEKWYNDGAMYRGDTYQVTINTKFFTRKKIVKLYRYDSVYKVYRSIGYRPEEKQMLIDLLPKAIVVSEAKQNERDRIAKLEREALEWYP